MVVLGVTFIRGLGSLRKATTGYLGDVFGRCLCASGRQAGSLAGRKIKLCRFSIISGVNGRAAPPMPSFTVSWCFDGLGNLFLKSL